MQCIFFKKNQTIVAIRIFLIYSGSCKYPVSIENYGGNFLLPCIDAMHTFFKNAKEVYYININSRKIYDSSNNQRKY